MKKTFQAASQMTKLKEKVLTCRLFLLNSDVVSQLLDYCNLPELMSLRKISPIFDEGVKLQYKRRFKRYTICSATVNINNNTERNIDHDLRAIENILTEIGPYMEELIVHYEHFNIELKIPISLIIHTQCTRLKSLQVFNSKFIEPKFVFNIHFGYLKLLFFWPGDLYFTIKNRKNNISK